MAFEIVYSAGAAQGHIALFPGAWDPPTVAHLEIARAALREAGQVVFVLPRAFPHKPWNPVGIEQRCAMLTAIAGSENAASEPGFSVALTDGGLYREIADEARAHFGAGPEISLICGRDAAERIASWDYGAEGAFEDLLGRYRLLVAARAGEYIPPPHLAPRLAARILSLPIETSLDPISSSEVRRRIASGEPWEWLVPQPIVKMVRELYVQPH